MNERVYHLLDKSEWSDGPWSTEPDKIVWVDEETGFDCMIVRNQVGSLCGYVGVPEGHPWYGRDYDKLDVDVHGGLTFASECDKGKREDEWALCHTAREEVGEVWWLGFDTAHAGDLIPPRPPYNFPPFVDDVYRTVDYIKDEVRSLARQCAESA